MKPTKEEKLTIITLTKIKLILLIVVTLVGIIGSPVLANLLSNVFWKENLEQKIEYVGQIANKNKEDIEGLKERESNITLLIERINYLSKALDKIEPQLIEFNKQIIELYKQKRGQ